MFLNGLLDKPSKNTQALWLGAAILTGGCGGFSAHGGATRFFQLWNHF